MFVLNFTEPKLVNGELCYFFANIIQLMKMPKMMLLLLHNYPMIGYKWLRNWLNTGKALLVLLFMLPILNFNSVIILSKILSCYKTEITLRIMQYSNMGYKEITGVHLNFTTCFCRNIIQSIFYEMWD